MRPGPLRGEPFEAFVAPARRRPALWRLGLGLLLILLCGVFGAGLMGGVAIALGLAPEGAGRTIALLVSFAGLTLGAVLAARLLGPRGGRTLLGPGGLRPRAFAAGMLATAAIYAAYALIVVGFGIAWNGADAEMPVRAWLTMLPLALLALFIQTSAEEIVFRGYLLQGLAARFTSPAIWLVAPAVVFGLLHWDPARHGVNAPLVVLAITVIGVALGDVTARTGNLSAAMGLHFAHNAVALLWFAQSGPLDELALRTSDAAAEPALLRGLLLAYIGVLLAGYGLWLAWNHRRPRG